MKRTILRSVGALTLVCGVGATVPAAADEPRDVKLQINVSYVKNPTLDPATPQVTKPAFTAAPYGMTVVVDPTAKISTKKFSLGGADLDDSSDPLNQLTQDQCKHYMLNVKIWKTLANNGKADVFANSAHGEWYDPKTPGVVARCKLQDGFGAAPKLYSQAIAQPTSGTDTYQIAVDAGLTAGVWPANAAEKIVTHRKTKTTVALAQ